MSAVHEPPEDADRPDPERPIVRLSDEDENPFAILGHCFREARAAGWSDERIAAFRAEATSGDYEHLLAVVHAHFNVQ